MGSSVSTGQDNDDLIDNLVEALYVRTTIVEKAFRAVDRAEYFLPEARNDAYKDLAWKSGNLHLSAPCIYGEVMECLCLKPGLSFLNLGSGTGYLSTMVGLIIGSNGINHGIEIYEDVIKYANSKLNDFKKYSGALDQFDFCEPKFIQGNCLCLSSDMRQYDRVYCGAACPKRYENYMKNMITVGGVLVMPVNDQLLQIKRVSETSWDVHSILPVSFATLITPVEGKNDTLDNIEVKPYSLQSACRTVIRNVLRQNIETENPSLKNRLPPKPKKAPKKKRPVRGMVAPFLDTSDDSDDEYYELPRVVRVNRQSLEPNEREPPGPPDYNTVLNILARTGCFGNPDEIRNVLEDGREENEGRRSDNDQEQNGHEERRSGNEQERNALEERQSGSEQDRSGHEDRQNDNQGNNEEKAERNDEKMDVEEEDKAANEKDGGEPPRQSPKRKLSESDQNSVHLEEERQQQEEGDDDDGQNGFVQINEIRNVIIGVLEGMRECATLLHHEENNEGENGNDETETDGKKVSDGNNGTAGTTRKGTKREKFDSGLGDEIVDNKHGSSSDVSSDVSSDISSDTSEAGKVMESCSSGDDDEDDNGRPKKRTLPLAMAKSGGKWRRIDLLSSSEDNTQEKHDREGGVDGDGNTDRRNRSSNAISVVSTPYTPLMKSKIQSLPLPQILKNYLNFYREF